jgi:adenylyltransferase/sulfurtransferase
LFHKPLIPSHFSFWYEPPDESGDEVLRIVSSRRSLKLKGSLFREFNRRLRPLLDGKHTMDEVFAETADIFSADDLSGALEMLAGQGVVVEGASPDVAQEVADRLMPQLNYFHEMTDGGRDLQLRLASAQVAVLGLGGAGAMTAVGLAAAGVGRLVCLDAGDLTPSDVYFSPIFGSGEVGAKRVERLKAHVRDSAPQVEVTALTGTIDSEDDIWRAIEGSDFVVSCLDEGMLNLAYKLNKVCLGHRMPWMCVGLEGAEIVVGPVFHPPHGPCYMCYRMRAVACAGNPEATFAVERHLDRAKTDLSHKREGLVFGAGIAGNMAGLEVVKMLTGASQPSLVGRLLTVSLQDLRAQKHTVLKKPMCPACMSARNA